MPQALTIDSEILQDMDLLISSTDHKKVTDGLLSPLQFRRYLKQAETIRDVARKYLIKAIIQLNYDRDLEKAEQLFAQSIKLDPYCLTAWTHYPSHLSDRGFTKRAYEHFKNAIDVVPTAGTLRNLGTQAIQVRDCENAMRAATMLRKMYSDDQANLRFANEYAEFCDMVDTDTNRLGLDKRRVCDILINAQDFIGTLGYSIVSSSHHFDSFRDEIFVKYRIKDASSSVIAGLNFKIAEFMVENDYDDSGLSLVVVLH